jgi:hypothetical protein
MARKATDAAAPDRRAGRARPRRGHRQRRRDRGAGPARQQVRARSSRAKRRCSVAAPGWMPVCRSSIRASRDDWHRQDGDRVSADQVLCESRGPARSHADGRAHRAQLPADTVRHRHGHAPLRRCRGRHRLPHPRHPQDDAGPALAQKYAVRCGGGTTTAWACTTGPDQGEPHRRGRLDRRGGRHRARRPPGNSVEVEVETLAELEQAFAAGADRIMLDEFVARRHARGGRAATAHQGRSARGLRQRPRWRRSGRSRKPAWTSSRSAASPSTCAPSTCRCASPERRSPQPLTAFSTRCGWRCRSPARSRRRGWSASG